MPAPEEPLVPSPPAGSPPRWQGLWESMFEQLKEFKQAHGHMRVSRKSPHTRQLAEWISTQRRFKAEGRLPSDRARQLEALRLRWKPMDDYWEEMYHKLRLALQGRNTKLPNEILPPELHGWVAQQRRHTKKGSLERIRVRKLQALGFRWSPYSEYFERRFRQLLAFKKHHGHCNVPLHYRRNALLGRWLSNQRKQLATGRPFSEAQRRLLRIGVKPRKKRGAPDRREGSRGQK